MKYLKEIDPKSIDWTGMLSGVVDFVKNQFGNVLSGAASIIGSIANGFLNGIISVIFAVYVLAQKEKILSQCERIARAYLKEKKYNFLKKTVKLLSVNFHNFITGHICIAFKICNLSLCVDAGICSAGCKYIHL